MVCRPCAAMGGGTCDACRQGRSVKITSRDVWQAVLYSGIAYLLTALYLIALR